MQIRGDFDTRLYDEKLQFLKGPIHQFDNVSIAMKVGYVSMKLANKISAAR